MDKYIKQVTSKLLEINRLGAFHKDSISAIISLTRQHLESNYLKKKYKITAFYCDWCLHSELNRNPTADLFLYQIDAIILDGEESALNDEINKIIPFHFLRKELIDICNEAGIRSILFSSYEGWRFFLLSLLEQLVDKPLVRQKKPISGKFALEFMLKVPDLPNINKAYLVQNAIDQNSVFWDVLVFPIGYSLSGPLVITEGPNDFK